MLTNDLSGHRFITHKATIECTFHFKKTFFANRFYDTNQYFDNWLERELNVIFKVD